MLFCNVNKCFFLPLQLVFNNYNAIFVEHTGTQTFLTEWKHVYLAEYLQNDSRFSLDKYIILPQN